MRLSLSLVLNIMLRIHSYLIDFHELINFQRIAKKTKFLMLVETFFSHNMGNVSNETLKIEFNTLNISPTNINIKCMLVCTGIEGRIKTIDTHTIIHCSVVFWSDCPLINYIWRIKRQTFVQRISSIQNV